MAVREIGAQTLHLGETFTVGVSAACRDADGDPLTFEALSSDTTVVRASVFGGDVTLEAVTRGTATVTVTAREDGLEATQSFEVTVPNRAPVVEIGIPSDTVYVGETATLDRRYLRKAGR